uniref:Integrase catalytic domain-containing protein n=1 Tax=Vitis vinifera TaxID=29760 RepID=A5B371_VITVI|nr:hypothetical protein VITISV_033737 [Vitis vinifera]
MAKLLRRVVKTSLPRHATGNLGITLQLSAIKPLTRNNFEEWYESFNVHMTLHNLDLALRVDEPNKSIKECVPKTERAKDFLEYVKANYTKIDKAEMTTYLKLLTTTMYDGVGGVRDHSIKLKHYINKTNEMKVKLSEKFLKRLILESLPTSFYYEKKKKGKIVVVVNLNANMIKTNIVDVHANFWWLDTGATIHITNSLQEMTNKRRSSKHEECVYMGNGSKVKGYTFHFGGGKVDIFSNSVLIGNIVLFGNLYSLSLHHGPLCDSSSINFVVGCKRARMNLSSSMLWHKRLGHISRQRLERFVRNGVFSNLDFSNFETCVVCLKGKMTDKTRKWKIYRCGSTLDLIHTDICGPLTPPTLEGYKYFITFIDVFSRYGYVELIYEKSDPLNVFKTFKDKVELQLGKPIKVVMFDRGGEYYGRYDESPTYFQMVNTVSLDDEDFEINKDLLRKDFYSEVNKERRAWFFSKVLKDIRTLYQEEFYTYLRQEKKNIKYSIWFELFKQEEYPDYPSKRVNNTSTKAKIWKTSDDIIIESIHPPEAKIEKNINGTIVNTLPFKAKPEDKGTANAVDVKRIMEQNNYTNMFLKTLGDQLNKYEERNQYTRASYTSGTIYEWNIDGMTEYNILTKLQEMTMISTTYKLHNRLLDHAIAQTIFVGFTDDLKDMLYEVMLNTSESESRTDSDNEDDINQLDSSGEISSQTSSDQEECIKGNCDCQPNTINVISQDQELVLDVLRKVEDEKIKQDLYEVFKKSVETTRGKLPYEPDFSEKNIPTKARPIQMNKDLLSYCEKEIQDLLDKKLIRKSKSPWSCSTFYVQKQTELERGTPKLVINYKPLNDALRWIRYPIPNKKDLLQRIRFLGHHIHQGTITPIQRSIEFTDKFPDEIKDKKQLQCFLGSLNYVSNFIRDLSQLCAPFRQKLKKNLVPWNEDHTKIVKIVKSKVKTLPCLALANPEAFKIVETDASNIGFGGILKQKVDNQERLERCRTLERKLEIVDFLKGHLNLLEVQAPFFSLENGENKQFTLLVNEANLSEDEWNSFKSHKKGNRVSFELLIYPRKSSSVPECDPCRVKPVVSRR